jgi:hypothetical protein
MLSQLRSLLTHAKDALAMWQPSTSLVVAEIDVWWREDWRNRVSGYGAVVGLGDELQNPPEADEEIVFHTSSLPPPPSSPPEMAINDPLLGLLTPPKTRSHITKLDSHSVSTRSHSYDDSATSTDLNRSFEKNETIHLTRGTKTKRNTSHNKKVHISPLVERTPLPTYPSDPLTSRTNYLNSLILSFDFKQKLTEWYGPGWSLLYQASQHGFKAAQFHEKCDDRGQTIVVIKCTDEWIFGGHNPGPWTSPGVLGVYPTASIFTLSNPNRIPPTRYACLQSQYSVCNSWGYGPTFGAGKDIYIASEANTNKHSFFNFPDSYEDTTGLGARTFTGASYFTVAELEVYGKIQETKLVEK